MKESKENESLSIPNLGARPGAAWAKPYPIITRACLDAKPSSDPYLAQPHPSFVPHPSSMPQWSFTQVQIQAPAPSRCWGALASRLAPAPPSLTCCDFVAAAAFGSASAPVFPACWWTVSSPALCVMSGLGPVSTSRRIVGALLYRLKGLPATLETY